MPPRTVKPKTTTTPVATPVKEEVIDKKVKKEVKKEPVVVKEEDVDKTSDSDTVVEEKLLGDTLITELTDKISSVQLEMKSIQQTLKLLTKE